MDHCTASATGLPLLLTYFLSKCSFFSLFFFLTLRLIQATTVQRFLYFCPYIHLDVTYPETSLHEHILWMGELFLRQRLPCLLSFKLIMTAYLILVIFYIFINTNMCHGCHSIFYNANFRDYLVIAFWKENVKYKTKKASKAGSSPVASKF